jgi:serine/threonine protein kinase
MGADVDLVSEPRLGRYVIHRPIASGGMATVHLGRLVGPAGFARTVAIKRLYPHLAKDPQFVSSLVDEARLAACIRHPNVASTLDVVERDDGLLVVMEYVHGESLARLARKPDGGAPPPLSIVLAVATQILYGLHAAHEATNPRGEPLNLVHRDVSPQNVVVGTDGVTRVLDFGVAKATGRLQETRDGSLKGKIAYMAPEQLNWEPVDRRTDIFAASAVIWEALTGERVFAAETSAASVAKILDGEVPKPSSRVPTLPPGLDDVVLRGLARKPEERFATALDMAVALEAFAPIATAREVGSWVMAEAGEVLAKRAEMVRELEQATSEGEQNSGPVSGVAELAAQRAKARKETKEEATLQSVEVVFPTLHERTQSGLSSSASLRRPSAPRRWWFLATGVVVIASLLGVAVLVRHHGAARGAQPAATREPPPVGGAPSLAANASAPLPAAAPSASQAIVPATPAPASAPRPVHTAPRATPGRSPKGPACDPPYMVGPDGIRRFRPECI